MQILLISTTFVNIVFAVLLYRVLNKSKVLYNDRFGYTVALTSSSTIGLVASLNLFLLFPDHIEILGVLNLLISVGVGWMFGSMVNAQSLIAGIYNGGIGGIMGTMAGAVITNPAICGLPTMTYSAPEIIIFFALLSIGLQGIASLLLLYSFRV